MNIKRVLFSIAALAITFTETDAYYLGTGWEGAEANIALHFNNDPGVLLMDGNWSWAAIFQESIEEWNQYMASFHVTHSITASEPLYFQNKSNESFFSPTYYGEPFDPTWLAVTKYDWVYDAKKDAWIKVEADIIFNTARVWDSYRGPHLSNLIDFRRVALHEIGHFLGLSHSDKVPGHDPHTIMNSNLSHADELMEDDIAGIQALYGATSAPHPKRLDFQITHFKASKATRSGRSIQIQGNAYYRGLPIEVKIKAGQKTYLAAVFLKRWHRRFQIDPSISTIRVILAREDNRLALFRKVIHFRDKTPSSHNSPSGGGKGKGKGKH